MRQIRIRQLESDTLEQWHGDHSTDTQSGVTMLELGQLIIDKTEGIDDIGVVVEVGECNYGDPYCKIYWVCRRTHGLMSLTFRLNRIHYSITQTNGGQQ